MSLLTDITDKVTAAPCIVGYPATGQKLPYVVSRPLNHDAGDPALAGNAVASDHQFTLYACGASVEASYNLARAVINELQGARVGGTTLKTSMGYSGALVEGHYETQITVQLNQGGN